MSPTKRIPTGDVEQLPPRERQILELLVKLGRATAGDVMRRLPSAQLSDSSIRTHLRLLEAKGFVTHEQDGPRYLYRPAVSIGTTRRRALRRVVDTFFGGSVAQAVTALIETEAGKLSDEKRASLKALIEQAKKEGR